MADGKRRYSEEYKLRILEEADQCKHGELGAFFNRLTFVLEPALNFVNYCISQTIPFNALSNGWNSGSPVTSSACFVFASAAA